ncbi:MAG: hypothetical protein J1F23_08320 [Oscillospiraceae bacterium]|nr:hypothetical protein [Oscillospiraceae bacterium]
MQLHSTLGYIVRQSRPFGSFQRVSAKPSKVAISSIGFPDICLGQAERPAVRRDASSQLALLACFAAHGKSFACWAVAPLPKKSYDFWGP